MLTEKTKRKLSGIEKCSNTGKHKVQDLFKIAVESIDLWEQAYANIARNKGAMTPGIDGKTIDGFSKELIIEIISELKENKYVPKPSKRVYIPKANGKTRPLGIISATDKLVQEVWRMLLERIYEPIFSRDSHGFRPSRSCHTALENIKRYWNGSVWFVEFDIKQYFDNINHRILIQILEKRINDPKFIRIIKRMLKAGYMENWRFNRTYNGTPQGGICSPILANIYLNELDDHIKAIQEKFSTGEGRRGNPEYRKVYYEKRKLSKKIKELKEQGNELLAQEVIKEWKALGEKQRSLPSVDYYDPNYKKLHYMRYADDFVLGLIGSKKEAEELQAEIILYLKESLNLEISPKKSGVRHTSEGIEFLGYNVSVRSNEKTLKVISRGGLPVKKRTKKGNIYLQVPIHRLKKFVKSHRYGSWEEHRTKHRPELLHRSDVEIILEYNAEIRGFANYYSLANGVKGALSKTVHLCLNSLMKTLANKHKMTMKQAYKWLHQGSYYALRYKNKEYKVFQLKTLNIPKFSYQIDKIPNTYKYGGITELTKRLQAEKCEYCGTTEGKFEVHHIKKLKDIKDGKEAWQKKMVARNRKTMVLCFSCHRKLHAGTLPDIRHNQDGMESRVR